MKCITQVYFGQVDRGPEFWESPCWSTNHSRSCNWGELPFELPMPSSHHILINVFFLGAQSIWWRHSREPCWFTTGLNSRFPHFLTLFCRQYECFRANAQELCMSRRWPPPTYDLSHEEGNLKIGQFVGSVPFGIFSFRFASWEKFHYKMHYWGEAHRGIIVTGHDLVIFFQTR